MGTGSTSEVWRGRDLGSGDRVVLRRLHAPLDPATLDALHHRIRLLHALTCPYLLRLRQVVDEVLVQDHAAGGSLADLLERRDRLSPGEVVTVAVPLATALASAHALGLVHGAVSTSTVLFSGQGMPLLAGLELAPLVAPDTAARLTYRDPASAQQASSTAAGDVWALAALCHHLLAGEPPSGVTAVPDPVLRIPLGVLAPEAPPRLVDAVEAVLAADPEQRPTAAAFASMLRQACPAAAVSLAGPCQPAGSPAPVRAAPAPAAVPPPPVRVAPVPVRAAAAPAAAPPAPVRLTPAPVAAADPLVPAAQAPAGRPDANAGRPRQEARTAGRAAARRHARRIPRPGVWRQPWAARCRRPALPVALLAVTACLLGWASSRGEPLTAPAVLPPAAAGPTITAHPLSPAPAAQWRAVLERLNSARAEAFAAGNPQLLTAVWTAGSAGLAADRAVMQQLVSGGETAHGVRHAVRAVEVREHDQPGPVGSTTRLSVIDELGEQEIRSARTGAVRRTAARGPTAWVVQLAHTPAGWRLDSVVADGRAAAGCGGGAASCAQP